MVTSLDELLRLGVLSAIDVELARALGEISGERDPRVELGAAFASAAIQAGHTCAELGRLVRRAWHDEAGAPLSGVVLPELGDWARALEKSSLVAAGEPAADAPRPLVLARGDRLYLTRYFEYEARLGTALLDRVGGAPEAPDGERLGRELDRLFSPGSPGAGGQRRAALVALLSRLSVISGGPGTGKTTTVAKLLSVLVDQALAAGKPPPRIALLTPTGKAAQRLGEAVAATLRASGGAPEVVKAIPVLASTLHRALGYQPRTPTRFRHGRDNPLPYDVIVVDEASMVDLALMTKLVLAVLPSARLVLLGDKDQLASVEAGSILADVYAGRAAGFSKPFAARAFGLTGERLPVLESLTEPALSDGMIELSYSHRFREGEGIAELARAVNAGDAAGALRVLEASPNVRLEPLPEPDHVERALGALVREKLGGLDRSPPVEKLRLLDGFRVLACHRRGPYGVEALNGWIARHLGYAGARGAEGEFYDGRPVIVTANDYEIDLFNGDVGVLGPAEPTAGPSAETAPLVAYFPASGAEGSAALRAVPLARLPPHETAFAMSVHKSQGSEFDEVALVLADRVSPVLTRELVYTAVTRARKRVRIFGSEAVLRAAIEARVQRASGLRERLWGERP